MAGLEQRDLVSLEKSPSLRDLLLVRLRRDFDAAREHQLGELADLEAAFGQRLQELVFPLRVRIEVGLAGVEELGRAFQGELEARLREVAGRRIRVLADSASHRQRRASG